MSELVLPPSAAAPAPAPPVEDEAAATRAIANRLVLTCCGGALLFNGFVAGETGLYAPQVAALSTMAGALILAAPILKRAAVNLWAGRLELDELIALGVAAAIAFADYLTAGAVAFFALLGELVEKRTALGARAAIESLVRLTPSEAKLVQADGTEVAVQAHELRPGQTIRVRPGENVPADGVIASGRSTLNEASITGESMPAEKAPGAEVFAGTLNVTGAIDIEVSRAGGDTTLGQVKELILAAEASRTPVARLIDRYVAYSLPLVLMLAFVIFFFSGDQQSFIAALVVACPTALVLATPTAMVAALSCAARLGILIKDARDIEVASRLTNVLFDKTGTLTTGELDVVSLIPAEGEDPARVLRLAAAVASRSTHPASRAVVQVAAKAELEVPEPGDTEELPGLGVVGTVEGVRVVLGRRSLLQDRGIALPVDELTDEEALSRLYVGIGETLAGVVGLEDGVRAEAKEAIGKLRSLGVKQVSLMTGDRWEVARQVGVLLAVDDVAAECLPGEKLDLARAARARGERVAVVGDGVNDAPALAAGDLGIAMGAAGADVAIGSARVALMNNDLRRVPFLIELSRSSRAVVTQNLLVAAGLVVGGLALAGAGALRPVHAILLHNLGSLFVVFNSARLIRLGEELA